LGLLVPLLKAGTICLICSRFKSGVVLEDNTSPCCVVPASVFRHILPCSTGSSDPASDSGPSAVGLGAPSSVMAFSNLSSSDEWSWFSAKGLILFSLLVSVLSVC